MSDEHGDWCERVADAIADGRFLEDPGFWRPHVDACDVCRARVGGLFALREYMRQASLAAPVVAEIEPEAGQRMIERAFSRFHRERRIRNTAICLAAALLCGAAALLAARGGGPQPPPDPVAYARTLNVRVFGEGSAPDYALLKRDAGLRAEYLEALDHPSSLVRRSAMSALLLSGVAIESSRLERALSEWSETLDTPIVVASASDSARFIADALARRRVATLRAALLGLQAGSEPGAARVASRVIVPFLDNADADVRRHALLALMADPGYRPGGEVTRLLASDPDDEVRLDVARCLVRRLGDDGASLVIGHLKSKRDDSLEEKILPLLAAHPATLAFSKERAADGTLPLELALAHERVLLRAGSRGAPDALIVRALRAPTAAAFLTVAALASEADWTQYRARLQEGWRALAKADRTAGGVHLAAWDVRAPLEDRRAEMALEIAAADRSAELRSFVVALAARGSATIRGRAQELLQSWPEN